MGKKIIKYITALSGILFLSSTDIGEDTRINLGYNRRGAISG